VHELFHELFSAILSLRSVDFFLLSFDSAMAFFVRITTPKLLAFVLHRTPHRITQQFRISSHCTLQYTALHRLLCLIVCPALCSITYNTLVLCMVCGMYSFIHAQEAVRAHRVENFGSSLSVTPLLQQTWNQHSVSTSTSNAVPSSQLRSAVLALVPAESVSPSHQNTTATLTASSAQSKYEPAGVQNRTTVTFVNFGNVNCPFVVSTSLVYTITAGAPFMMPVNGRITNIRIQGQNAADFSVGNIPPTFPTIPIAVTPDGFPFTISFRSNVAGLRQAELIIEAIDEFDQVVPPVRLPLTAFRNFQTFELALDNFVWPDTLDPGQQASVTLGRLIQNTGTLPLNWDRSVTFTNASGFRLIVDNVSPNPTPVGGFSNIRLTFLGAPAGRTAFFIVPFVDEDCGVHRRQLAITIYIRPNPPNITTRTTAGTPISTLNMGRFLCETAPRDTTIQVYNSGQQPLLITAATVSLGSEFQIINPPVISPNSVLRVDPESSSPITLRYTPRALGTRTTTITFLSNARNAPSGTTLTVSVVKDSTSLAASTQSVDFGVLELNSIAPMQTFVIRNTGTVPITLAAPVRVGAFLVQSISPNTLAPGSAATVTVLFTSTMTAGSYVSTHMFPDACDRPTAVTFRAQVFLPRPAIGIASPVNFGNIVCSADTTVVMAIRNITRAGGLPISISNISITGPNANEFQLLPRTFPFSVNAGEAVDVAIRFRPTSPGLKQAQIIVNSNAENVPGGTLTIEARASKENAAFAISRSQVQWVNLPPNTPANDTLTLFNTGSKEFVGTVSITPQGIFSINQPARIPAGGRLPVSVTFNGAADNISGQAVFTDECGNRQVVMLAVSILPPRIKLDVNAPNALVSAEPAIGAGTLGTLLCETQTTATLTVSNDQGKDLVVSGFEFQPPVQGMEIIEPATLSAASPLVLTRSQSRTLTLRYTAQRDTGVVQTRLILRSNAANGTTTAATLQLRKELLSFDISLNSVEFPNLPPNTASTATLTLVNTGTLPIQWARAPFSLGNRFSVVSITPNPTPPRQQATLTVRFDGAPGANAGGTGYVASTSLTTGFGVSCDERRTLQLRATVLNARATLAVGQAEAAPGNQVEIPIYLRNAQFLTQSQATEFAATLRYDYSLLFPDAAPPHMPSGIGTIRNNNRLLPVRLPLSRLVVQGNDTVLARLKFTAALGHSTTTTLSLDEARALGTEATSVQVDTLPGLFRLTGLCEVEGTRLFRYTTQTVLSRLHEDGNEVVLAQSKPNPALDKATIDFVVDVGGRTTLVLYSLFGKEIRRLVDAELPTGMYHIEVDAASLESGVYFYALHTPTTRATKRMEVVK
jgi:hypothetical protein